MGKTYGCGRSGTWYGLRHSLEGAMLSDFLFRIRSLFRRDAIEHELDEELQFHIDQQVEKNFRAGLTREEATRQTRLQFGGLSRVKEDCRESRGVTFLETTAQDVRF